jgi:hypothetical protein
MAQDFFRNQNPSDRVARLNYLSDRVDDVASRIDDVAAALIASGGQAGAVFDPGDLSVYYQNGKA